jgi:hypothetical protein
VFGEAGTQRSLQVGTPAMNKAWAESLTRYLEKVKAKARLSRFMDAPTVAARQRLVLAEIDKILAGTSDLPPTYQKTFRKAFKPMIDQVKAARGLKVRGVRVTAPKKPRVARVPVRPSKPSMRARVPARPPARARPVRRSGPMANKIRAERMIKNVAGADSEYVELVKKEFRRLPGPVTELLEIKNVAVRVGSTMGRTARGLRVRKVNQTPGIFVEEGRPGRMRRFMATVSHTIHPVTSRALRIDVMWQRKVVAHEAGHAFDSVLGNVSRSQEFRQIIRSDIAKLTSSERNMIAHYITIPEETFAESFAQLYTSARVPHGAMFKRKFKKSMAYVKKQVDEANEIIARGGARGSSVRTAADKKGVIHEVKAVDVTTAYITDKQSDRITIQFLIVDGGMIGDGLVYIGPGEKWEGWSFEELMAIDFPNVSGEIQVPKNA